MNSKLLRNLCLTFGLSLFCTGVIYYCWFYAQQRGFEEGQDLTILLAVGALFNNALILLASLPVLLLTKQAFFQNRRTRWLCYFGGPVLLTLLFTMVIMNGWEGRLQFLIAGLSFIGIHTYFYLQLPSPSFRDTVEMDAKPTQDSNLKISPGTGNPVTPALLLQEVSKILWQVKEKITDESDVLWTSYDTPQQLRHDIEQYLSELRVDCKEGLEKCKWLFAPTGTLQEHSMSNGWAEEYISLASQFDRLYDELKKHL
jgi:hypothetical protein